MAAAPSPPPRARPTLFIWKMGRRGERCFARGKGEGVADMTSTLLNCSRCLHSAVQNNFGCLLGLLIIWLLNICRRHKCKEAKEDEISGRCPSKWFRKEYCSDDRQKLGQSVTRPRPERSTSFGLIDMSAVPKSPICCRRCFGIKSPRSDVERALSCRSAEVFSDGDLSDSVKRWISSIGNHSSTLIS